MKNLAQHIESLIIKHECVIVPGLGGFLTYRDRAIVRNNRLYAPTERIRFNSLLTYQDGLLAEAYMRDRNIGYTEALDAINTEVEQIKKSLNGGSPILFGRIGALSLSAENNIMLLNSNPKFLPENIGRCLRYANRNCIGRFRRSKLLEVYYWKPNVFRKKFWVAI